MTLGRRCQWLPGKSPAVEGDALVPEPPPPSRPPLSTRFCSILRILSEPNDLHTALPSTKVMPALTIEAGAAPLGGGWSARETPRRATPPPPRETQESQRGCGRARCLHSRRPTPSPAGFCTGACSLRALAEKRGEAGRLAGADSSAGWSDWHLWAQWDHGYSKLYFD